MELSIIKKIRPGVGCIVHYVLDEADVTVINRKRKEPGSKPQTLPFLQLHVGNTARVGNHTAMVVVAIWPNEYGPGKDGINGQVLLDGNDSYWVTSAREDNETNEPGTWHWPEIEL